MTLETELLQNIQEYEGYIAKRKQELAAAIAAGKWTRSRRSSAKAKIRSLQAQVDEWKQELSGLEPTLKIDRVISELSPAGDVPKYNRYGVYLEVHISGTGIGILKLSWGTDYSETKTGIVAGNYAYVYNLPPGTHSICAVLF